MKNLNRRPVNPIQILISRMINEGIEHDKWPEEALKPFNNSQFAIFYATMDITPQTSAANTGPLASVALPAYNAATTIAATIESILQQDYENFELIIINDGSTDNTDQIIRSFADERIVYRSRENRGIVATLNECIERSRGEFILRMDSDDIALPHRFHMQIERMKQDPSLGILGGQAIAIDETDAELGVSRKPVLSATINAYAKYACPVLHPTYCVRRTVYEKLKGYRSLPSEDYDFLLRAIEADIRIENLSDPLIKYRLTLMGISSSNPYRMLVATRLHQRFHAVRQRGRPEQGLVEAFDGLNRQNNPWASRLLRIRQSLICTMSVRRGIKQFGLRTAILFLSLLHPAIAGSSYRLWRASALLRQEQSHATENACSSSSELSPKT